MKINLFKPLTELRGIDYQGIYSLIINEKLYIGSNLNIKNPKTRTIRKIYKISYNKLNKFPV